MDLGGGELLLRHIVHFTSDGGSLTTCAVFYPTQQVSAFMAYGKSDPGAKAAGCIVLADFDGPADHGYWRMSIDASHTTGKATFTDEGSNNGKVVILECTPI